MITLEDCKAFCEAPAEKVDTVCREQHLVPIVALACAHASASKRKPKPAPRRSPEPEWPLAA
ncbi:MAG TPA: hypothetical protein PKY91_00285 [Rhodocyclaceae bacterium]|jgi:hypothetical protein|nr:hypothetical protein [Rhodocyclaceae bacterium]HNP05884.1 hypothetical protein [Rhodocyclaceae bacterium]